LDSERKKHKPPQKQNQRAKTEREALFFVPSKVRTSHDLEKPQHGETQFLAMLFLSLPQLR
jgi:hypothetical protein